MSIFEYDKVEEEKKLRKAEFEAGVEQGIEKGLAQGIERGEKQASVKTATRMLQMGSFSLEQIAGIFVMIISMLVSFMFSKRIRKLDMVEILKGVE